MVTAETRLIELIKDGLIKNSQEMLELLSSEMIYFSLEGVCLKITRETVTEETQLSSNQEEAGTKLLLHANHVLHENQNQNSALRSPSGDVDINILCLAMFPLQAERMCVDYGTGDHRHILTLNSIDMHDEKNRLC